MGRRIQPTSKLSRFIKKNYGTAVNFGREINKHFKTEVFLESSHQCKPICNWARGENKPRQSKWKWDLMVKYCKKVHNVNVDLTWIEPQPETKAEPVTEQPQLDFDDTAAASPSRTISVSKAEASNLIRRAYNIFELSDANTNVSMSSTCTQVSDGYWPTVIITVYNPYHIESIDLGCESDLLKVSGLLDKLADGFKTETDEELINRVFDGIDPKDIERVAAILQRKGGRDE